MTETKILSDEVESLFFAPVEVPPRRRVVRPAAPQSHGAVEDTIRRAAAAGLDLDEISNRNLVAFYSEELRGGRFKELSKGTIGNLKGAGLISPEKRSICLTEKAIKILEAP